MRSASENLRPQTMTSALEQAKDGDPFGVECASNSCFSWAVKFQEKRSRSSRKCSKLDDLVTAGIPWETTHFKATCTADLL
eukprot:Skav235086  [mRNA]  locus=scaffold711:28804:29469:+ [translate_table: standard]